MMKLTARHLPIEILCSLALSAVCCAAFAQGKQPAGVAPDGAATANGAGAPDHGAPAPDSSATKGADSYSLGLSFASQWRDGGLDGILSVDDLVRGIRAGLGGAELTADDRKRASALLKGGYTAWAGRNQAAAEEFLARNAKQPGVTTTSSGLQYRVLTKGDPTAPSPGMADRVTVQYRGRLIDGTEFDSTYRRGKPSIVRRGDVIAGWREALGLMTRGAEWRLFIPPNLAYGLSPPPSLAPNSLLIFDVSLVAIDPAGAPRAAIPAPQADRASTAARPTMSAPATP